MTQSVRSLRAAITPRLAFSERCLLLRIGDLLLISASIALSFWIWLHLAGLPLSWEMARLQIPWAALVFFGWPAWLFFNDMYNLRWAVQVGRTFRRIAAGSALICIGYLLIFFVTSRAPVLPPLARLPLDTVNLPLRLAPAVAIAVSTMLLLTWRVAYALILGGPHARRRLLILGAGQSGCDLVQAIRQLHGSQYHLIGFVDDSPARSAAAAELLPVFASSERLLQLAELHAADEVVVAMNTEVRGALFQAIMDCHEHGVAVTPMPLLYERLTGKVAVEHIGSDWYVALPLQQAGTRTLFIFIKRLMDIAGGLAIGAFFLLVWPLIALAIKLDSPGPVFYLQERVGQHGRPYTVRKFRSMVRDAEGDGQARWAVKGDSRITRVGAFLRKTRLDEMPQVINVLRGEMSLVGPRPERAAFIDQLQQQIPFYRTRLVAKPGLTGWAQVNYGYGSTVKDALIKLQYDLFYVRHQNPWFDLTIMLRTIGVVLRMKGQ